jgi:hypothetical protein
MDNDTYVEAIDGLDKLTYLAPLPLTPPNTTQPLGEGSSSRDGTKRRSFNPITMGVGLALCVGGAVTLMAWIRKRQIRHRREMELDQASNKSMMPASVCSEVA